MSTKNHTTKPAHNFKDLTGQRFGRLTIIARAANRGTNACWVCRCDCGNEIETTTGQLRFGTTKSCGCYLRDRTIERNTTHGQSKRHNRNPTYTAWAGMKRRCYNPNDAKYPRYGGRGIEVCDRWRDSFENFLADMNDRPSSKHSLGRIDNDGPYSPENCRWETNRQQANNRSTNHVLEHNGEFHTIAQWERLLGFKKGTVKRRILKGWPTERALTEPVVNHATQCQP